jgi:hypothetical protein
LWVGKGVRAKRGFVQLVLFSPRCLMWTKKDKLSYVYGSAPE